MFKKLISHRFAKLVGFAAVIPLLVGHGGPSSETLKCIALDDCPDYAKLAFLEGLYQTSWRKSCFPIYVDGDLTAYKNVELTIDSSLEATFVVNTFNSTDTSCDSMQSEGSFTAQFNIIDSIVSDESIEVRGLNVTFLTSPDLNVLPPPYSLIYVDSEKLHFGQNSGGNLGWTSGTRQSSISLDNYYEEIIE